MKPIFLQLATTTTLLLLLFLFTTTTAIRKDDNVLDVYGDPLKPGQDYYLVPTTYAASSGGFNWTRFPDSSPMCPTFFVTQVKNSLNFGEPIALYPRSKRARDIRLSSDLRIEFFKFRPGAACRRGYSSVWGVAPYKSTPNYIVIVEGDTSFTIEDDPKGSYNIKFYTGIDLQKTCGALGIVLRGWASIFWEGGIILKVWGLF